MSENNLNDELVTKTSELSVNDNDIDNDNCDDIVEEAKTTCDKINNCICKIRQLDEQLKEKYEKIKPMIENIGPLLCKLEQLTQLERLLKRFNRIKQIVTNIDELIPQQFDIKDKEFDNRVVIITNEFKYLIEEYEYVKNRNNLQMKLYIKNILVHYKDILLDRFEKIFKQILNLIQWPMGISTNNITSKSNQINSETINSFKLYFTALLDIDIDKILSDQNDDGDGDDVTLNFICLPINIMIMPLKKRFHYHFMETKSKLNRLEKPEWYLSQILTWIKANQDFLFENVDPLLSAHFSTKFIPAKIQLIYCLLQCVNLKLKADLPIIIYDDNLFTHQVDEVLLFNRELLKIEPRIQNIEYDCDVLKILSIDPFSTRILNLEKKKATEFVESIIESETVWSIMIGSDNNDDGFKIPECADNFLIMLQSVTDRCLMFKDVSMKHAFVKLELELLDDFRLRLTQLLHSEIDNGTNWPPSSQYSPIINTVNYLFVVLNEWKNLPFFVELAEIYSPNETLFDGIIDLFEHMSNELLNQIIKLFMNQAKNKMQHYKNNKWFCVKDFTKEISSSACELLHFITSNLVLLQNSLAVKLFERILYEIVDEINLALLEIVVLENSFNQHGAMQLNYDVTAGFISIFRVYMRKPEVHFAEIREACKLLTLQRGTALLLEESLKNKNTAKDALKDLGIESLSIELSLNIMGKRIYSHENIK